MPEPAIHQVNALNRNEVLVTLLDGRVLVVTLTQILSLKPRVLLSDDSDED